MDRATGRTIGWHLGDRSAETLKAFYEKIKHLKATFYVDDWKVYPKVIPTDRLITGKEHTISIEQNNSNIRHYLGRMTRRTKVVSRSSEMVDLSLRLCWYLNEAGGFEEIQTKFIPLFS